MNNALAVSGVVIKELYRRKDFYVLLILTVAITLVMGSVNFFNEQNVVRYLKEICLLLIWISSLVIAIGTAARQIPMEREHRTIFPLLAKPISRAELLLGKFLGCWFACGITLLLFYLFLGLLSGAREHQWPMLTYFQAVLSHWVMLGIIVAFTLLGSLVFTAPSSNATICLLATVGILFLGRHLNQVASQVGGAVDWGLSVIYFAIPHLEFFDARELIVHNHPAISWKFWLISLGYGSVYTTFFLLAATMVFKRKPLQ